MVEGTKITVQPTDVSVTMANMTARVNIVAEGESLSYQWYLKNPNATKLSKSSITSDTYSVKMSEVNNGRQVYCVVTDQFGNSVRSDIISLSIKLAIKEQPTDVYARIGEKVSTSVVAEGDGSTYQWYLKNKTGTKFTTSSVKKDTYVTTMSNTVDGRQLYCVVTDQYGNTATTTTVTLYTLIFPIS